jgi:hypothetical protein
MGERRSIFLTANYILLPGSMLSPLGQVAVEAGASLAFIAPQHIPICHRIAACYLHCLARTNEPTNDSTNEPTNQLLEFTFSNDILIHSGKISQLHSCKRFIRATPRQELCHLILMPQGIDIGFPIHFLGGNILPFILFHFAEIQIKHGERTHASWCRNW